MERSEEVPRMQGRHPGYRGPGRPQARNNPRFAVPQGQTLEDQAAPRPKAVTRPSPGPEAAFLSATTEARTGPGRPPTGADLTTRPRGRAT